MRHSKNDSQFQKRKSRLNLDELRKLRRLVLQMEKDLGLGELSQNEVDILCAASEIGKSNEVIESSKIKKHELVNNMKSATFHRALKSLLEKRIIEHFEDAKSKRYIFTK